VSGNEQLFAFCLTPHLGGGQVNRVKRAERTRHWLRGAMEDGSRELDDLETFEDVKYGFASHGNVVR
jgi:hypothetical protein